MKETKLVEKNTAQIDKKKAAPGLASQEREMTVNVQTWTLLQNDFLSGEVIFESLEQSSFC